MSQYFAEFKNLSVKFVEVSDSRRYFKCCKINTKFTHITFQISTQLKITMYIYHPDDKTRFSFTVTDFYFTPMILVASMSIVSGVIVAALYHQERSRPVPPWLRKITGLISSTWSSVTAPALSDSTTTQKSPAINVSPSAENKPYAAHENLTKVADNYHLQGGHGNDVDAMEFGGDFTAEWQRCAVAIDRLTGKIACAVTLIAVIVTVSMLAKAPS